MQALISMIAKEERMKTLLVSFCLLVSLLPMKSAETATPSQDQTFRLMNLERRCDLLQQRVDQLERQLQNQALNSNAANDPTRGLLVEMQQQQLSLNQQLLTLQQQQFEMRKAFDLQANRLQEIEKRAAPANEAKPASETKAPVKAAPRKP